MTADDIFLTKLTAWRENRSGAETGMQSVINVISNRANKRSLTYYRVCTEPDQFSSITVKGDPQLNVYAQPGDPEWVLAGNLVGEEEQGTLEDITGGATGYYAASMQTPPYWAADMTFTVEIAGQRFYK